MVQVRKVLFISKYFIKTQYERQFQIYFINHNIELPACKMQIRKVEKGRKNNADKNLFKEISV